MARRETWRLTEEPCKLGVQNADSRYQTASMICDGREAEGHESEQTAETIETEQNEWNGVPFTVAR